MVSRRTLIILIALLLLLAIAVTVAMAQALDCINYAGLWYRCNNELLPVILGS
jgi:hypothetical protein